MPLFASLLSDIKKTQLQRSNAPVAMLLNGDSVMHSVFAKENGAETMLEALKIAGYVKFMHNCFKYVCGHIIMLK